MSVIFSTCTLLSVKSEVAKFRMKNQKLVGEGSVTTELTGSKKKKRHVQLMKHIYILLHCEST